MTGKGVRLDGVRKRFGDVVAVAGIDLRVEPGELLVLLGPSGCGKTTTLRAIAGLEPVTEGTIRIGDRDATGTLPQDRDVSMAFQNYALYPHKTVEGNLRFPLAKTDLAPAERDEKVAFVAELLEIGDILDREPSSLSGGQRQRVALGRTIVREPGVFLLDEPLSSLDAELRVATRTELRDLQQRLGTTTVYVTHDQEEAMSVADRIAVMRDGRIEQIGTPRELYVDPATAHGTAGSLRTRASRSRSAARSRTTPARGVRAASRRSRRSASVRRTSRSPPTGTPPTPGTPGTPGPTVGLLPTATPRPSGSRSTGSTRWAMPTR
jgi:multiple sugar transport system ATP-binding protein